MERFDYFQPTRILFGAGRVEELGKVAREYGRRCLLVTTPPSKRTAAIIARAKKILIRAGLEVCHFHDIQPNPTTANISDGAGKAREFAAEMVVGFGGGSSMDSAKAIAVEATHDGRSWDYLFYSDSQPTAATLPVIAVSTTSGTGSQVTQVAVVTHTKTRNKSAIYNRHIFPRVGLIDPELMVSVPAAITAATGFDAFTHAFESTLHPGSSPMTERLAWKAIEDVIESLPQVLQNPKDLAARTRLAYADTLAGLCIANAGVTLPHGIGMAISGMYPHVAHGVALAIIYPAFMRFTWNSAIPQFSRVGKILDAKGKYSSDEAAAGQAGTLLEDFLGRIGLLLRLKDVNMPENEIADLALASMVLPDYRSNPRVATGAEMEELIRQAYDGAAGQPKV